MIESIIVRNIRSFIGRHEFEIRPITIFLGRNSSGKSTITRLLPLLQQSLEQRLSAPILWNGALVDFGSISDVRPHRAETEQIGIGFSLKVDEYLKEYTRRAPGVRGRIVLDDSKLTYEVLLGEQHDKTADYERTRLTGIRIEINGDILHIEIDDSGKISRCLINEADHSEPLLKNETRLSPQEFFPAVRTKKLPELEGNFPQAKFDHIEEEKYKIISLLSHGTTTEDTKRAWTARISYASKQKFNSILLSGTVGTDWFREQVSRYQRYSPEVIERLRRLALLSSLPSIINLVNIGISSELSNFNYVGPARAAGERYYRWRELAVDRLDPKGENFAMYVMSLNQPEQQRLSNLLEGNFGFALKARRDSGHASIMLSEIESGEWFNLADMGFGFSQILPVIAQVHAGSQRRPLRGVLGPRYPTSAWIMAVEQPELHLHPAFQAKIADLFCEVTRPERINYLDNSSMRQNQIVVETHSEALVNRLSELVANGKLSAQDAVIYIFDKDEHGGKTAVRKADFSKGGEIENWPYGFFHY